MHTRDNGTHVLTITISDDEKAEKVQEYIDQFGSDTAAVMYALNQQMQREVAQEEL